MSITKRDGFYSYCQLLAIRPIEGFQMTMMFASAIATNFGNFLQSLFNGPAGSVLHVALYIAAVLVLIPLFRTIKRERRQLRIGGIIEIVLLIIAILLLLDPVQGVQTALNATISFGSWIIGLFNHQVQNQAPGATAPAG